MLTWKPGSGFASVLRSPDFRSPLDLRIYGRVVGVRMELQEQTKGGVARSHTSSSNSATSDRKES